MNPSDAVSTRWSIRIVRAAVVFVSVLAAAFGLFGWWWLCVSVIGLGSLLRSMIIDDAFGEDGSYVIFEYLWSLLFVILGPFGAWVCADRVVQFLVRSK